MRTPRLTHGLNLGSDQLCLIYGRRARIRLFSRPDTGTLAVFSVPMTSIRESARYDLPPSPALMREPALPLVPFHCHNTLPLVSYS